MGWRLDPDGTGLLLVDLQEKLVPAIHESDRLVVRCRLLLQSWKALGLPMQVTEQYPKGLGHTIDELRAVFPKELGVQEKTCFSAAETVREHSLSHWVVAGIETHICVRQTCLDLIDAGKECSLAVDAVGARRALDHEMALEELREAGVRLTTVEAVLFECLKDAQHEQFKTVSRLIKES